jgi:hypothetical protein
MQSATIIIRVKFQDKEKSMKFSPDAPIWEIVKEIQEKTGEGGNDHLLYQPAQFGNKSRWLLANHTLRFYDIQSNVCDFLCTK